jgi:hypothetical protein
MIGEDLVGDHVARHQPGQDPRARDRGTPHPRVAEQVHERRVQVHSPGIAEVPGQDPEHPIDVGAKRAVRSLLNPEVLECRHALCTRDPARGGSDQRLVNSAVARVARNVDAGEHLQHGLRAARVRREELVIDQILLHEHADHRRQAPGVRAGPHPQVVVGELRRIRKHGVHHDHRPLGVLGDLVQDHPRAREALRHPRVLADEHRHLGALELASGVSPVEGVLNPRLARLLLRQRARAVARSERPQERSAVAAPEMVALPATAVEEDRLPPVLVADLREPSGDLGDRGVPADLLIAPVRPAPHRTSQTVRTVLIVVQPHRLIARIALAPRVRLVTADPLQPTPVQLDLDSAVALAQDAGSLRPRRPVGRHAPPPHLASCASSRWSRRKRSSTEVVGILTFLLRG